VADQEHLAVAPHKDPDPDPDRALAHPGIIRRFDVERDLDPVP
jgi:hypothetical protein